jgi:hypothetical protein
MGVKFQAVRKDEQGNIRYLLTDTGEAVSIEAAKSMARRGEVDSLTDLSADGRWEVDNPDGSHYEGRNLNKLPEF